MLRWERVYPPAMEFTYDIERQLISMVEERRCLWHSKDENYHRKHVKENAYREISEQLGPKCTVAAVKSRWANLRSQFQRELRKIKESLQNAHSSAEVYVPRWGHFQRLQFLKAGNDDVLTEFTTALELRSQYILPKNGRESSPDSREEPLQDGPSFRPSGGFEKRRDGVETESPERPAKLARRENSQPDQCHGFGIMMEHSVREIPEGPNRDLAMLLAHQALVKFKLFLNDQSTEIMEQAFEEFFRK